MTVITCYFSTPSPYAYLAGRRLEEIAARHGAEIDWKPLDLIALFARTGGQAPKDRHPARQAYRLQELRRQARKAGMTLNLKPAFWPVNPAPSCYAVIAAQAAVRKGAAGDLGALIYGFLRACWAEERDIADTETISAIMAAAGFDPAIADRGMMMAADTYVANLEEAVTEGVFGAPFYTVGDEKFWGQDRLDDLDLHLAGKL
jgi:2-hydroxychromene-2-carboxylate isomerase